MSFIKLEDFYISFKEQFLINDSMSLFPTTFKNSFPNWISRITKGEHVNHTEGRPVLHVALRGALDDRIFVNDRPIIPQIVAARQKQAEFQGLVQSRKILGTTNQPIRQVVNIGIGGSDLGPRLVVEALSKFHQPTVNVQFVANLDSADLAEKLKNLDPAETLFTVASKTFTTAETRRNLESAIGWLQQGLRGISREAIIQHHIVALTANPEEARRFGVQADYIFEFWDWVGGRFSLWSSVGLPIALAIGYDNFEKLLAGARAMDQHFFNAPVEENIPVLMALIGAWNIEKRDAVGLNIVPYSHRLQLLPAYLQQLEMESNGKRVDFYGNEVEGKTATIIFGGAGTNVQHSYFQMLHQGTWTIPTDFIAIASTDEPFPGHADSLLANCFAQSSALAQGWHDRDPHKSCSGGQPSTMIILPKLDPYYLGMLLAMYEHKVFVQGMLWQINSFDQWGVELGKRIAKDIEKVFANETPNTPLSENTYELIEHVRLIRAQYNSDGEQ